MVFDLGFLEGIIVVLLIVFIVVGIVKKATRFIVFCICVLIFMQVGFMLSKTDLNDTWHLDKYFKYDVVSSIKQIWEDDGDEIIEKTENGVEKTISTTEKIINEVNKKSNSNNNEVKEEVPPNSN